MCLCEQPVEEVTPRDNLQLKDTRKTEISQKSPSLRFGPSRLKSVCACEAAMGKADSTLRSSRAVPHPSTNRALCRLTSEVGRDPVHSTRYGRQRQQRRLSTHAKPHCTMCTCNFIFRGRLARRAAFPGMLQECWEYPISCRPAGIGRWSAREHLHVL